MNGIIYLHLIKLQAMELNELLIYIIN